MKLSSRSFTDEKNISAKQSQTRQNAWVQSEDGNQRWTPHYQCTQSERKKQTGCVIESTQALFFKPEQRLTSASQFDAVFKKPLRSRDRYFLLLSRQSPCTHTRLGLIVSKKRIRKAVARNRVKRIIRDSFRLHQHQLPAVDVVLLAYQSADTANSQDLRLSLDKHWKKLQSLFPQE